MSRAALPRTDLAKPLGQAIKARLELTDPRLSQLSLATAIDVSRATMERWLAGRAVMTVDNLSAIARVLGCLASELVRDAEAIRAAGSPKTARVTNIATKRATKAAPATRRSAQAAAAESKDDLTIEHGTER